MAAPQATKPRGPGGRPKKADAEVRHVVPTRMTIAEHNHARDLARTAGLSLSEYLRRRALGEPVVVRQGKSDARLIHELNQIRLEFRAIGNNANQIALNKHTGRTERLAWENVIAKIDRLSDQAGDLLHRAAEQFDD